MPLSFGQYQGLFWTAMFASLASMAGSALIVGNTLHQRQQRRIQKRGGGMSLQQRLVFALSVNDFFASLNTATLALMVPAGTPSHYWAVGSATTCTISGFLTILFFLTTTCYNCSLSIYYLLTVRYNVSTQDKMLRNRLEIPTHVLTWTLSLTFAILGVLFHGYNPKIVVNICFLDSCSIQDMVDTPGGCPDGPTDSLAGTYICAVAFFALVSCIATGLVYRTVRQKINGSDNSIRYQNLPEHLAKERLRLVSSQAVAYTAIYLNLLLWQSVLVVLSMGEEWAYYEGEGQGWFYFLQWMSWLFIPGQGFLNCLVYTRPKYLRWRHIYPKASMFWLYWKAFRMEDPPKASEALDSQVTAGRIVAPSSNEDVPPAEVFPSVELHDREMTTTNDNNQGGYPQANRIVRMSSFTDTNVLVQSPTKQQHTQSTASTANNSSSSKQQLMSLNRSRARLASGQQAILAKTLARFDDGSLITGGNNNNNNNVLQNKRSELLTNYAEDGSTHSKRSIYFTHIDGGAAGSGTSSATGPASGGSSSKNLVVVDAASELQNSFSSPGASTKKAGVRVGMDGAITELPMEGDDKEQEDDSISSAV